MNTFSNKSIYYQNIILNDKEIFKIGERSFFTDVRYVLYSIAFKCFPHLETFEQQTGFEPNKRHKGHHAEKESSGRLELWSSRTLHHICTPLIHLFHPCIFPIQDPLVDKEDLQQLQCGHSMILRRNL